MTQQATNPGTRLTLRRIAQGLLAVSVGISALNQLPPADESATSAIIPLLGPVEGAGYVQLARLLQIAAASLMGVGLYNLLNVLLGSGFGLRPPDLNSHPATSHTSAQPGSAASLFLSRASLASMFSGAIALLTVTPIVIRTAMSLTISVIGPDTGHTPPSPTLASADIKELQSAIQSLQSAQEMHFGALNNQFATLTNTATDQLVQTNLLHDALSDCSKQPGRCMQITTPFSPDAHDPVVVDLSEMSRKLGGINSRLDGFQQALTALEGKEETIDQFVAIALGGPQAAKASAMPVKDAPPPNQSGLLQLNLGIQEYKLLSDAADSQQNVLDRITAYFTGKNRDCVIATLRANPAQNVAWLLDKVSKSCRGESDKQSLPTDATDRPGDIDKSAVNIQASSVAPQQARSATAR
jgi:hypothetical protein